MTMYFRVIIFEQGKVSSSWRYPDLDKALTRIKQLEPGIQYELAAIIDRGTSPYTSVK